MSARALVVGLDGLDLDLVASLGPAATPALHGLMARGAHARLRSVRPPATLPNWLTFLTGRDPGEHGVFDFTTRDGYRVAFTGGTVREAPTVVARLDRLGLTCACLGFPGTWPPERLARGLFVSGWDSPVAFEADRSFVWPPDAHDRIVARFGPIRFDDVDELAAGRPGWHAALPGALAERIRARTRLAEWLLAGRAWDLFAVYFGESDTAAHHLWAHHDPASPRHPPRVDPLARGGLARVYRALDAALAALLARAGEGAEVTVVSDHGSGGAGDKVLYLNRALARAGLLRFRRRALAAPAAGWARDRLVGALPGRARQALFSAVGRALPGWVESRARFGAIDMAGTTAFSDELNYFPSVCLNLRGREPAGTVDPRARGEALGRVAAALEALRDPWTGARVVRAVHRREALYRGPHVGRAPDLVLEMARDGAYSYNLMPSAGAPPGGGPWRRLAPSERVGRKGRSLPGSHRDRGALVMAGPRVRPVGAIDARIADATATVLARLGVEPPADLSGRVLDEAVARPGAGAALPAAPAPPRAEGDRARVEARLRALGYLE